MMNRLYFDCTNGIAGDMVLNGLAALGVDDEMLKEKLTGVVPPDCEHCHEDEHGHEHHHSHRSYEEIKGIIENAGLSKRAEGIALKIYETIALAESKVHGTPLSETHFHEVGRSQAILNILGVAICIDELGIEKVYASKVNDGKGTIICSHGEIPVPVPAVSEMMKVSDLSFGTLDVDTELVTPTGLGILMGLDAADEVPDLENEDTVMVEVKGTRETGLDGLKIYLF